MHLVSKDFRTAFHHWFQGTRGRISGAPAPLDLCRPGAIGFASRISLEQRVQAAGEAAGATWQADTGTEKAAGKLPLR